MREEFFSSRRQCGRAVRALEAPSFKAAVTASRICSR